MSSPSGRTTRRSRRRWRSPTSGGASASAPVSWRGAWVQGTIVFQIPDFGDRFWGYALYDARTDEFSEIGKAYGTKPGFYLLIGPDWKGEKPAGITAVVRSSTNLAFGVPRVFMNDTPEDQAAVQPFISQVNFYPLSEFDGKMKIKDWSKLPHLPATWPASQRTELQVVNPATFLDDAGRDEGRAAPRGR